MTRPGRGTAIQGMLRLVVVGLLGGLVGVVVASAWNPLPLGPRGRLVPAPYRIPKIPGGTPLRLAMVHDVLHERYLRHGPAWYSRRNELARATIARESAPTTSPSPALLDALDDLAVGLESAGQYDESIATLRKKLVLVSPLPDLQKTDLELAEAGSRAADEQDLRRILSAASLPPKEHHQYTTCANLGTVLIHSALPKALAGDTRAKYAAREGLDYIKRSIAINPGAHFGRETWQAIAVEHLVACIDHPELITKYDLIGDSLDDPDARLRGGRPLAGRQGQTPEGELTPQQRLGLRAALSRVGIDRDWAAVVHPDYARSMPFDEPTLAIVGMWTLGSGPSPHFSLALGTVMEIVGERQIAWNAYERAVEMGDKFYPAPDARARLVSHCRQRQRELAREEASDDSQAWEGGMRRKHQEELAWGRAYQEAYQDFEAARIAAGVPLDDPHFYDAFFAGRPAIASNPGLADDIIVTDMKARRALDLLPCFMLGLGLGMVIALVLPERHLS